MKSFKVPNCYISDKTYSDEYAAIYSYLFLNCPKSHEITTSTRSLLSFCHYSLKLKNNRAGFNRIFEVLTFFADKGIISFDPAEYTPKLDREIHIKILPDFNLKKGYTRVPVSAYEKISSSCSPFLPCYRWFLFVLSKCRSNKAVSLSMKYIADSIGFSASKGKKISATVCSTGIFEVDMPSVKRSVVNGHTYSESKKYFFNRQIWY